MNLTRSGLGVLVSALVVGVLGVRWGYTELVVVAAAAVVAVATAWVAIHRPVGLEVSSRSMPKRLARGSTASCRVKLQNDDRRALPPVVVIDTLLDQVAETFVSGVRPGGHVVLEYELQATRRGVHPVGPLLARRQDFLGLLSVERRIGPADEVIVHPRVLDLAGSRGADHITDLESQLRRASHDPLAGFQSLREYVSGDDPRTIHWASTARAGQLMVREFVDARRPRLTVILDSAVTSHADDGFEDAVDVAASLTAHAVRVGLEVTLRTNDGRHRGDPRPVRSEFTMLDLLARVTPTVGGETLPFAPLVTLDGSTDSVLVVTGPHGAFPRLPQFADRLTIVRVGVQEGFRRVGVIGVSDAEAFQRSWAGGA